MILLTDEEIVELNGNCIEAMGRVLTKGEALRAGSVAQLKKVVESLKKEDADNYTGVLDGSIMIIKVKPEYWQSLLDEVKEA